MKDAQLTAKCSQTGLPSGLACGDYAVNTTQPFYQPYSPGTADIKRLPPLNTPNIGDRLSAKRVDWAWYSGGWSNANGDVGASGWTNGNGTTCTDPNHLATAVFPQLPRRGLPVPSSGAQLLRAATRLERQARKDHLKDEAEFIQAAKNGRLKQVSFIKPVGEENGASWLHQRDPKAASTSVDLVKAIVAKDRMARTRSSSSPMTSLAVSGITFRRRRYNRHGAEARAADQWGPGTRIPALLISKRFDTSGVAHEDFDTTSILKLLEKRFDLDPLVNRAGAQPLGGAQGRRFRSPLRIGYRQCAAHHARCGPVIQVLLILDLLRLRMPSDGSNEANPSASRQAARTMGSLRSTYPAILDARAVSSLVRVGRAELNHWFARRRKRNVFADRLDQANHLGDRSHISSRRAPLMVRSASADQCRARATCRSRPSRAAPTATP